MKRLLKGFYMSFTMFCAVPRPIHVWDDKCLNVVLPCFPLIGAFVGAVWWGVSELILLSGIHIMLTAAVLTIVPFLLTGFIHLDGFMDTSDAVLSRRPIEDKLRILKDPHAGAFAVIMLAVLFILQFAAMYVAAEKEKLLPLFLLIPVISRSCAAMSILCLKTLEQSNFALMFRQKTGIQHKLFIVVILIAALVLFYFIAGINGLIVATAEVAGFALAMLYAYKDLKGVSGDIAGYALVISELCAIIAMAFL